MRRLTLGFFILLLFSQLAFAQWESVAAISVITSAAMLGLLYMIGFGFGIHELILSSKEEAYQLVVVIAMIGGLIIVQTGGDAIFGAMAGYSTTIQDTAKSDADAMITNLASEFGVLATLENDVAYQGSRSLSCTLFTVGHTISGCGGYSMVSPAISGVEATVGLGIAELSSLSRLMMIGKEYSFLLLLPVGIILRTFKITRGAGGLIIALAIALYFVLPLMIITMFGIADQFKNSSAGASYKAGLPSMNVIECVPQDTDDGTGEGTNPGRAMNILDQMIAATPQYIFAPLIYGIITPAIALLGTIASLRALASISGADIDVSALSKVI